MQKNQEIKVVLGGMYGDEGKGVTVQWLCQKALNEGKKPLVIRFSGGSQAGHTFVHNGVEHICSSFGSGVLLGVQTTHLAPALLDPICLCNEVDELERKGVTIPPVCPGNAIVITPYDVIANQKDEKNLADGTCGKGVWKAFSRSRDMFDDDDWNGQYDFASISHDPRRYLKKVRNSYHITEEERNHELEMLFIDSIERIIKAPWHTYSPEVDEADVLIFEGTQGLLLDAKKGFKPHVTATEVGLHQIEEFLTPDTDVYLVYRTYMTRHGADEKLNMAPTDITTPDDENNVCNEYQGEFKVGMMDFSLVRRAVDRHVLDTYNVKYNIVITHTDCLNSVKEYKVIDDYGAFTVRVPMTDEKLPHTPIANMPLNERAAYVFNFYMKTFIPIAHIYTNDSKESNIQEVNLHI